MAGAAGVLRQITTSFQRGLFQRVSSHEWNRDCLVARTRAGRGNSNDRREKQRAPLWRGGRPAAQCGRPTPFGVQLTDSATGPLRSTEMTRVFRRAAGAWGTPGFHSGWRQQGAPPTRGTLVTRHKEALIRSAGEKASRSEGRAPTQPCVWEEQEHARRNLQEACLFAGNCSFSSTSQSSDPRPGLGFPHSHPNSTCQGGAGPVCQLTLCKGHLQRYSQHPVLQTEPGAQSTGLSLVRGWRS